MMRGAIYVSDSGNTKIMGSKKVDATYASIKNTCPDTCSLKDEGCYAQTSFVGMINSRMDRRARQHSPLKVARAEAKAIDQSYKGGKVPEGRDLRLRVSGDCRVIKGGRSINAAVGRWKVRGGGDCWAYTHAWANVPRKIWTNVSILASIENVNQVAAARKMGYAPALVVAEHTTEKAYTIPGSDVRWLPCPAQTKPGGKEIACVDCRLCFNANRLFDSNMGITFAIHGVKQNSLKKHLSVIQ
jgi:hypothetical protein